MSVKREHVQSAIVGGAIAVALIGGTFAAKQLLESGAAVRTAGDKYGLLQAKAAANPPPRIVPFLGPFAHNVKGVQECGPAVRLMEGALRRTKPPVRKAAPRNCLGEATKKQLQVFQKRHGIRTTGIYGSRTHRALAPRYTRAQRRDLIYIARIQLLRKQRAAVLVAAGHARVVGGRLPYCQSSIRSYFPAWPRIPPCTDCSGYATWIEYQAGVGPRVGYFGPGSPVGWTGTLARQGHAVGTRGPLRVGDLIFYGGGYPYGHVAVYIGHGLVTSHGSVSVKTLPFNYRPVSAVRRLIY
jgi:hypothetical protein